MDAALRNMLTSSITVRRPTALSASGSETLGAAVTLPAYVELKRRNIIGSVGGRSTYHLVVLDADDVAGSALGTITADDRFWLDGADSNVSTYSKRPESVQCFTHPLTRQTSHYEVTL